MSVETSIFVKDEESIVQNPLLQAGKNKYLANEFIAERNGVLPDPMLGYTQWIEPIETRVGAQQNIFSLSQKIPFPGKLGLKEDIGLAQANADKYDYSASKLNLIYNVKINYYDLYLADRSILILQDYFSLLKDFVDISIVKYSTGEGIQAHVLKAQVEHSTIQSRIFDLQRRKNSAQSNLNELRSTNSNKKNNATGLGSWVLTTSIKLPAIRKYIQISAARNAVSVITNHRLRLLSKSARGINSDAGCLARAKTTVERNRRTNKARICSGIPNTSPVERLLKKLLCM